MTSWVSLCEDEDEEFRELNQATEVREFNVAQELEVLHGTTSERYRTYQVLLKRQLELKNRPEPKIWFDLDYYRTGRLMTLPEEEEEEEEESEGEESDEEERDGYELLFDQEESEEEGRPLVEEEEGAESVVLEEEGGEEEGEVEERPKKPRSLIARLASALRKAFFPCVKR